VNPKDFLEADRGQPPDPEPDSGFRMRYRKINSFEAIEQKEVVGDVLKPIEVIGKLVLSSLRYYLQR
jgi:hypothetical protein